MINPRKEQSHVALRSTGGNCYCRVGSPSRIYPLPERYPEKS